MAQHKQGRRPGGLLQDGRDGPEFRGDFDIELLRHCGIFSIDGVKIRVNGDWEVVDGVFKVVRLSGCWANRPRKAANDEGENAFLITGDLIDKAYHIQGLRPWDS